MEDGSTGLTIHCNPEAETESRPQLKEHCNIRKYIGKVNTWFGICLDPQNLKIKFVLKLGNEWKYSEEMEAIVNNRLKPQRTINFAQKAEARKKLEEMSHVLVAVVKSIRNAVLISIATLQYKKQIHHDIC